MITDQAARCYTQQPVCAISGITAVASAQSLPYNSKHAVLMFRSWPEPLLQQQSFLGAAASTVRKVATEKFSRCK